MASGQVVAKLPNYSKDDYRIQNTESEVAAAAAATYVQRLQGIKSLSIWSGN